MFRYIAFVWDPHPGSSPEAAALIRQRIAGTGAPWSIVVDEPGLFLSCVHSSSGTDDALVLDNGAGAILGTCFERPSEQSDDAPRRATVITPELTEALLQTNGRSIRDRFWGSYVLVLRHLEKRSVCVFRGPMARLPCFHTPFREGEIFFSSVADLLSLGLIQLSINWRNIRAQAVQGDYLTHNTGINEISTLECGECLQFSGRHWSLATYWDPRKLTGVDELTDIDEAAAHLRSVVQRAVNAWASSHESVLHLLSGGLDSSIVLSCLARAPSKPRITNLTFFSRGPGDERRYAKSMALHTATKLIEVERDSHVDLRMFLQCARTASPVLNFSACFSEPAMLRLSREHEATAIFDGELGDNVFGQGLRQEVLAEYAARHGVGLGFAQVALDYATARNVTIWRALYLGLREGLLRRKAAFWSAYDELAHAIHRASTDTRLASADAIATYEQSLQDFIHPWMQDVEQVPAGKRRLLYGLMVITSTSYHSPFSPPDAPPLIAPLASEPVVELALRIPSHMHLHDAQDRAVARRAFASALTPQVLHRGAAKGGPELWVRDIVQENQAFLRETLLDGILVKERILDRRKMESVLASSVGKMTPYLSEIIMQLYIEAWLRQWPDRQLRAAA